MFREAFLSAGDVASYQSVSDNMAAALPLLSDSVQSDVFSLTLPVPPPLETRGRQVGFALGSSHHLIISFIILFQSSPLFLALRDLFSHLSHHLLSHVHLVSCFFPLPLQAQRMFSWRSFLACHGLFPLHVWNIPSIEYCMQVQHLICFLTCSFPKYSSSPDYYT